MNCSWERFESDKTWARYLYERKLKVWTRENVLFDQCSLWIMNSWTRSPENLWSINNQFDTQLCTRGYQVITSWLNVFCKMNEAKFYKSKKMSITKIYRLGLIIQITTWVSPLPFEKYEKRMLAKLFYQNGKILANMLNSKSDCQMFSKFPERFFILLIGKKIFRLKCKYLLSCQEEHTFSVYMAGLISFC